MTDTAIPATKSTATNKIGLPARAPTECGECGGQLSPLGMGQYQVMLFCYACSLEQWPIRNSYAQHPNYDPAIAYYCSISCVCGFCVALDARLDELSRSIVVVFDCDTESSVRA